MKKKVTKAIIPAAGFGTRMLPFTKAVPKELTPLVDKPVLQYVVEEAVSSGIEDIMIIISSGKEAVIRHFESAPELEMRLLESGKDKILSAVRASNSPARIEYIYQPQLNGLGGAIRLAENFAAGEPVAVLLGDTVLDSSAARPVTGQLIDVYEKYGSSVIALEQVDAEKVSSYGIADAELLAGNIFKLHDLMEKPSPEDAPGDLAVASRYLFTPGIFSALQKTTCGLHNEIQLTDAIRLLLKTENVFGCQVSGKRFDLGTPDGFIAANVEFAMRCPELRSKLMPRLRNILNH
ncbi:MAG: UTP--glucose-1-phosphate uridylyltransferase [Lentisphaeria bacterium]|nr:UTP--glucose-1-phosphate uridylyltransferase [Lentisphaeria bacterium]